MRLLPKFLANAMAASSSVLGPSTMAIALSLVARPYIAVATAWVRECPGATISRG